MPEDASLDQFASSEPTDSEDTGDGPEDAEDDSEDAEVETEDAEAATENVGIEDAEAGSEDDAGSESPEEPTDLSADTDTSSVEPAVSTYGWSSDGRECDDCGASAERLWRGEGQRDGGLVCADCKEW